MIIAQTLNHIRTSPPWEARREIVRGELVELVPANNMPEDSDIKYWVKPYPFTNVHQEWHCDAASCYGIAAYKSDVRIIEFTE